MSTASENSILVGTISFFRLEVRVPGPSREEVNEGAIQMAQTLLEHNAGNLSEPGGLRLRFEHRQEGREISVGKTLALFSIDTAFEHKRPIVDPSSASKGPSKDLSLLDGRVPPEFICALGYAHTLSLFSPVGKPETPLPSSPKGTRLISLLLKQRVLRRGWIKNRGYLKVIIA
jgi:hypothetical protein